MQEVHRPALDAETIRRQAAEEVLIALTRAEVDALHTLLNSLLDEIRAIAPSDRAGVEPETTIMVEEWQR
jgi:hypothetical protein